MHPPRSASVQGLCDPEPLIIPERAMHKLPHIYCGPTLSPKPLGAFATDFGRSLQPAVQLLAPQARQRHSDTPARARSIYLPQGARSTGEDLSLDNFERLVSKAARQPRHLWREAALGGARCPPPRRRRQKRSFNQWHVAINMCTALFSSSSWTTAPRPSTVELQRGIAAEQLHPCRKRPERRKASLVASFALASKDVQSLQGDAARHVAALLGFLYLRESQSENH